MKYYLVKTGDKEADRIAYQADTPDEAFKQFADSCRLSGEERKTALSTAQIERAEYEMTPEEAGKFATLVATVCAPLRTAGLDYEESRLRGSARDVIFGAATPTDYSLLGDDLAAIECESLENDDLFEAFHKLHAFVWNDLELPFLIPDS
ncbi:hypothetical protein [Tranquillimonas alkanivorans]|uniref:Uncharacterized protein n=1 Tax=Tranquillimonas alkanivorans TaxID=441119 RepID=A0A1I5WBB5_9RHOB|nr:hypothetical protein [Tranquillimonas alkanivorans]SFQ17018.1 hypothetical protein SAMN04488047_1433 [Tranquillimonas alkanivorans]